MDIYVAIVSGLVGGMIYQWVKDRRAYKYKWKCPVCTSFTVSASTPEIVERVKQHHIHEV